MILSCPECQNQFYVQNDQVDQIVKCSRCEKEIKVLASDPEPENNFTCSAASRTFGFA